MKIQIPTDRRRPKAGVALTELAISLALLITIVLGCVDVGRFAYSYVSVSSAANEAAAFASLHAPGEFGNTDLWVAAVRQRAVEEAPTLNPRIQATDVHVDLDVLPDRKVSVNVSYTFQTVVDWPLLPARYPMNRRIILSQTP